MIALLSSELGRLASRRLYRWVVGLVALGILIGGTVAFVRSAAAALQFADVDELLVAVLSFPLVVVGWLIGASAIGAEWQHRTVTALLTWEPRRTRVFTAKAAATTVSVVLVVAFLAALFTAALFPAAAAGGSVAGIDGTWWADYAAAVGRLTLVAVAAALMGFALATIGKNTSAALGGGFAYLAIAEPLLQAWKLEWRHWLIVPNLVRVIAGPEGFGITDHSVAGSAGVLAVWVGIALLVALWFFRRREMG